MSVVLLQEPVAEICRRLGVKYNRVAQITIRPGDAEVVCYLERDGSMYIDEETNKAASETLSFKVRV